MKSWECVDKNTAWMAWNAGYDIWKDVTRSAGILGGAKRDPVLEYLSLIRRFLCFPNPLAVLIRNSGQAQAHTTKRQTLRSLLKSFKIQIRSRSATLRFGYIFCPALKNDRLSAGVSALGIHPEERWYRVRSRDLDIKDLFTPQSFVSGFWLDLTSLYLTILNYALELTWLEAG